MYTSEPEISNDPNHKLWLGQVILEEHMKAATPVCSSISQPLQMVKLIAPVAPF